MHWGGFFDDGTLDCWIAWSFTSQEASDIFSIRSENGFTKRAMALQNMMTFSWYHLTLPLGLFWNLKRINLSVKAISTISILQKLVFVIIIFFPPLLDLTNSEPHNELLLFDNWDFPKEEVLWRIWITILELWRIYNVGQHVSRPKDIHLCTKHLRKI